MEDFVKRAKALTKEIEESAVNHGETVANDTRTPWGVSPNGGFLAAERDEIILSMQFFFGGEDVISCKM